MTSPGSNMTSSHSDVIVRWHAVWRHHKVTLLQRDVIAKWRHHKMTECDVLSKWCHFNLMSFQDDVRQPVLPDGMCSTTNDVRNGIAISLHTDKNECDWIKESLRCCCEKQNYISARESSLFSYICTYRWIYKAKISLTFARKAKIFCFLRNVLSAESIKPMCFPSRQRHLHIKIKTKM